MADTPFWTIRVPAPTLALMRRAAGISERTVSDWGRRTLEAEARRVIERDAIAALRRQQARGAAGRAEAG